ncbi:MAG: hypothetical protein ACYC1C_04295 [Chloroflexota bacterium]
MSDENQVDASTPSDGREEVAPPAEYAAFIRQIELTRVWLQDARVTNHHGPSTPKEADIHIHGDARWEPRTDGFRVFQTYSVDFNHEEQSLARVEVTFGLQFGSEMPMTEPVFVVFRRANLPVNTWPYLREFLDTMTSRMNWAVFTLPTLKRVPEPPKARTTRSGPTRRPRQPRKRE